MAGTFLYSPEAEEDLVQIWLYIAEDSEERADNFLFEIDEKSALLAEHPEAGRERPELAPSLRSFALGRYTLFYRPADIGVEIVRVLHGSRDIASLF